MTESTSSHTHISAVHGDITRQPDCDCIVNAAFAEALACPA